MTKPAIHAVSSWEQLSLAVPELTGSATGGADGEGEQWPLFLVEASYPQKKFGQQLAEAVGAVKVTQLGDVLLKPLFEKSSIQKYITSGMCCCGRKALILARCKKCVQDHIIIIIILIIIMKDEVQSDGSGSDAPAVGAVSVPAGVVHACVRLVGLPLLQRARGALARYGFL